MSTLQIYWAHRRGQGKAERILQSCQEAGEAWEQRQGRGLRRGWWLWLWPGLRLPQPGQLQLDPQRPARWPRLPGVQPLPAPPGARAGVPRRTGPVHTQVHTLPQCHHHRYRLCRYMILMIDTPYIAIVDSRSMKDGAVRPTGLYTSGAQTQLPSTWE